LLPLGGAAAGLLVGASGLLIAGGMHGVAVPGWLLTRAAGAGVVLTCGVELLARGTLFGERRALLFWGSVAAIGIFVLSRLLSQGTLSGYVMLEDGAGGVGKTQGGAEVALLSPGGYSYRTLSLNSGYSNDGFYAFRRVPAGQYTIAYRPPGARSWWQSNVQVDFAITAGTQMDLVVSAVNSAGQSQ
jgi:hypothetical protein